MRVYMKQSFQDELCAKVMKVLFKQIPFDAISAAIDISTIFQW